MPRLLVAILALGLALACGGGPRQDPLPRRLVAQWNEPMTVEILKVWDVMDHHVNAAPEITHTMEVKVVEGPTKYVGKTLFLPYDRWAVGEDPPPSGNEVTMMPSQWVVTSPTSRGAPK